MKEIYLQQVALLFEVLPLIRNKDFVLKGGTAINFFYRAAPRLSVDIDLTYVPIKDRADSYFEINSYLEGIQEKLERRGFHAAPSRFSPQKEHKIVVTRGNVQIKIEPNYIVRGLVLGQEDVPLTKEVHKFLPELPNDISFPCASFCDVYAGKLCAALERQNPRDLFDVRILLDNEGIEEKLKNVFIYYLMSSKKPYYEMLDPRQKELGNVFRSKFEGMERTKVDLDTLTQTFLDLKRAIHKCLRPDDVAFLISTLSLVPAWDKLEIEGVAEHPSIKWRMFNLGKMNKEKRHREIEILEKFIA